MDEDTQQTKPKPKDTPGFCKEMAPTKFAEDLLLFITRGKKDFGVEAFGLKALPRRGFGAGSVPGFHLDVQVDLEQVWVLLLDVTGIQVIPDRRWQRGSYGERVNKKFVVIDTVLQKIRNVNLSVTMSLFSQKYSISQNRVHTSQT